MADWMNTVRGALLFDQATYADFHARRDVFARGVLLVLVVSLLVTLPTFAGDLVNGLRRGLGLAPAAGASAEFERALDQMEPMLRTVPDAERDLLLSQMRQSFELGADIATRIEALPTALPKPVGGALRALGGWLSRPFSGAGFPLAAATLGTWMGYGLWVMLAAKLLGGRADLAGFLGTTGLFAIPHTIKLVGNSLGFLPVAGPSLAALFGLVAFIWGAAIYVKSTAVSQELSVGRALLAVVLPLLVLAVILLLALFVLGAWLAALVAGAGR